MDRHNKLERILIALPWLSLPFLGWHFVSLWDRLPTRMAVHFDLQGHPNGWQSPKSFALVTFVLLLAMLITMTALILHAFRHHSVWRVLTLAAYMSVGTIVTIFWQVVDHGVYGTPMSRLWPMPAIVPLGAVCVALTLLSQMRSCETKPSAGALLIAEEQHRSPQQLLFVLPGMGIGIWLAVADAGSARMIGIFLAGLMAWVAVGVSMGFRYLILTDGVQIDGFLLPLRFIPRSTIRKYRQERWKGIGYGIRLTSTGTAYIWGGRDMVNISTDTGDVMLGHKDPQRLIGDLDQMMNSIRKS